MDKYTLTKILNAAFESAELNCLHLRDKGASHFKDYVINRTNLLIKTVDLIIEQQKRDEIPGTISALESSAQTPRPS